MISRTKGCSVVIPGYFSFLTFLLLFVFSVPVWAEYVVDTSSVTSSVVGEGGDTIDDLNYTFLFGDYEDNDDVATIVLTRKSGATFEQRTSYYLYVRDEAVDNSGIDNPGDTTSRYHTKNGEYPEEVVFNIYLYPLIPNGSVYISFATFVAGEINRYEIRNIKITHQDSIDEGCGIAHGKTYPASANDSSAFGRGVLCKVYGEFQKPVEPFQEDNTLSWKCLKEEHEWSCTAYRESNSFVNGECGTASGKAYSYTDTSYGTETQCSVGEPSSTAFPAEGDSTTWKCSGANGGSDSATCFSSRGAAPVDAVCGTAHGKTYPASANDSSDFGDDTLCTVGTPQSPIAPFIDQTLSWTCQIELDRPGASGGDDANCSANKALTSPSITGFSPTSATLNQLTTFTISGEDLPDTLAAWIDDCAGITFTTRGQAEQKFTCTPTEKIGNLSYSIKDQPDGTELDSGTITVSGASVDGVCGTANNKTYSYTDTSYGSDTQCAVGTSTNTVFPDPSETINWLCSGLYGGQNSSCSANRNSAPTATPEPKKPVPKQITIPAYKDEATQIDVEVIKEPNGYASVLFCHSGATGTSNYSETSPFSKRDILSDETVSIAFTFGAFGTQVIVCAVHSTDGVNLAEKSDQVSLFVQVSQKPDTETPTISGVSPNTATVGALTTFTITGENLPDTLAAWIDDCAGITFTTRGQTEQKFTCTPTEKTGELAYSIKDELDGTELKAGTITVSPAPVDAKCGTAGKIYGSAETSYGNDTFCSAGSVIASILFPEPGETVLWECLGENGGNSASCSAARSLPLPEDGVYITKNIETTLCVVYPIGEMNRARWKSNLYFDKDSNGHDYKNTNDNWTNGSFRFKYKNLETNEFFKVGSYPLSDLSTGSSGHLYLYDSFSSTVFGSENNPYPVEVCIYHDSTDFNWISIYNHPDTSVVWNGEYVNEFKTIDYEGENISVYDWLSLFPLEDNESSPSVSGFTPTTVGLGALTTFTITGTNLPNTLAAWVDDCAGITFTSRGQTEQKFTCTPAEKTGDLSYSIKDQAGGTELKAGTITVNPAPVNAVCGTADGKIYGSVETEYGSDTFCSAGSVISSILFPEPGETVLWECLGENGGSKASCSATRTDTPIDGECGTAHEKQYSHTETGYGSDTQCVSGEPSSTIFPAEGETSTWVCSGTNEGSDSDTCSATRTSTPNPQDPKITQTTTPAYKDEKTQIDVEVTKEPNRYPSVLFCHSGIDGSSNYTESSPFSKQDILNTETISIDFVFTTLGEQNIVCAVHSTDGVTPAEKSDQVSLFVQVSQKPDTETPTISGFSPNTATVGALTTFTITGENLPDTLSVLIDDCADITFTSRGQTEQAFTCTPTEKTGELAYSIKDESDGTELKAGTVTINPAPVDAVCGSEHGKIYTSTDTEYASDNFCSVGSVISSILFPEPRETVLWECLGENGGSKASCSVSRAAEPVDGQCGIANSKQYAYTVTSYGSDTQCAQGEPSNTAFPAEGEDATWTCSGTHGGEDSETCSSSRDPAPKDAKCGTAHGKTYPMSVTDSSGFGDDTLCEVGNSSVSVVSFFNNTAQWFCSGGIGENIEGYDACEAFRDKIPEITSFSPSTIQTGRTTKILFKGRNLPNNIDIYLGGENFGKAIKENDKNGDYFIHSLSSSTKNENIELSFYNSDTNKKIKLNIENNIHVVEHVLIKKIRVLPVKMFSEEDIISENIPEVLEIAGKFFNKNLEKNNYSLEILPIQIFHDNEKYNSEDEILSYLEKVRDDPEIEKMRIESKANLVVLLSKHDFGKNNGAAYTPKSKQEVGIYPVTVITLKHLSNASLISFSKTIIHEIGHTFGLSHGHNDYGFFKKGKFKSGEDTIENGIGFCNKENVVQSTIMYYPQLCNNFRSFFFSKEIECNNSNCKYDSTNLIYENYEGIANNFIQQ